MMTYVGLLLIFLFIYYGFNKIEKLIKESDKINERRIDTLYSDLDALMDRVSNEIDEVKEKIEKN